MAGGRNRHLAFRDYLHDHPEEARAYGNLIEQLARRYPNDIQAYMDGKNVILFSGINPIHLQALHHTGVQILPPIS
jgi:GrpB-like predicted nucleotidyltransferase (UPF0157 family)